MLSKKFNDVCVLFKHSNFCSRMLEMHSKRPSFQFFSQKLAPSVLANLVFAARFFSFSTYSKAFATFLILLKILYRPPKTAILKLKIYWLLHVIERNWKLICVVYVHQITICLVPIIVIVAGQWFFVNVFIHYIYTEKVSPLDYFLTLLASI